MSKDNKNAMALIESVAAGKTTARKAVASMKEETMPELSGDQKKQCSEMLKEAADNVTKVCDMLRTSEAFDGNDDMKATSEALTKACESINAEADKLAPTTEGLSPEEQAAKDAADKKKSEEEGTDDEDESDRRKPSYSNAHDTTVILSNEPTIYDDIELLVQDKKLSAMPKLDASSKVYCKVTAANAEDANMINSRFKTFLVSPEDYEKALSPKTEADEKPTAVVKKDDKMIDNPADLDGLKKVSFTVQGVVDIDAFNTDLKELVGQHKGVLGRD